MKKTSKKLLSFLLAFGMIIAMFAVTSATGWACRTIYFHGLCEGGITVADYHGNCDDICAAIDFPILIDYTLITFKKLPCNPVRIYRAVLYIWVEEVSKDAIFCVYRLSIIPSDSPIVGTMIPVAFT